MRHFFLIFLLLGTLGTIGISFVNAAPTALQYAPPCLTGNNCPSPETPAAYISSLYTFALGIGGILAVGMIVWGGVNIIFSAAVDKVQEGKDIITSALWGLALLFGSYLILQTVNPALVNLNNSLTTAPNITNSMASTTQDALVQCLPKTIVAHTPRPNGGAVVPINCDGKSKDDLITCLNELNKAWREILDDCNADYKTGGFGGGGFIYTLGGGITAVCGPYYKSCSNPDEPTPETCMPYLPAQDFSSGGMTPGRWGFCY